MHFERVIKAIDTAEIHARILSRMNIFPRREYGSPLKKYNTSW
jgi:hypothetical protein